MSQSGIPGGWVVERSGQQQQQQQQTSGKQQKQQKRQRQHLTPKFRWSGAWQSLALTKQAGVPPQEVSVPSDKHQVP
jgi:hypothetical protein